jgi:ABC-type phosphate/phosphonate transport system permease subunit
MQQSHRFSLNINDFVNLGKDALLVGAGSLLTYLMENINTIDWGSTGVLLVPVITLLLDAVVKWVKGPK